MNKIEVGTKLYLKPVNNMARYGKVEIKEVEVTKVGRKYFEVDGFSRTKFAIEGLKQFTKYSPDWEVYFSKQDILDETEHENLTGEIKSVFKPYGKIDLTLDQLRRIKEIITE